MDSAQWLSVTEETLFLHDGLVRVSDLVELPNDIPFPSSTANFQASELEADISSYDTKTPAELSEKLSAVCATQNYSYTRLLEYRLNALCGLWNAQCSLAPSQPSREKDGTLSEEAITLMKKQGLWKEPEQAAFTVRVSFLLVLPLLESQSRLDPSVCGLTTQLLSSCLRDCPPLSLAKEPPDCLNGLESLLCKWIGEGDAESSRLTNEQLHVAVCAIVALASAR